MPLTIALAFAATAFIATAPASADSTFYKIVTSSGAITPATDDVGNHGDDVTTDIALPFPVSLYGTQYTTAKVSSNGNIQFPPFGADPTEYSLDSLDGCLPTSGGSENDFEAALLALQDDQRTDNTNLTGEGIFTATQGTAPNRSFIVEFRTEYYGSHGGLNDYEIIFHENDPTLTVIYGNLDGDDGNTQKIVIGAQGSSTGPVNQFFCNDDATAQKPASGTRLDFVVAPTAGTAPSISGNSVNGQTLTANSGSFGGSPGTPSFQWQRCDASGNGCVDIPGATANTYTLTTADIGHAIRVRQTSTNPNGSASSESAPTAAVAPNPARCSNVFTGTNGNDTINGTIGGDVISGLGGADIINGGAGADCLSGGAGNDKLSGGSGNDTINGGAGKDKISGGAGNDRLSGGSGNDTISAGQGRNVVSGGAGNDRINTVNGKRDRVNCGSGKDVVRADKKDKLRGCERVLIVQTRRH